MSDSVEQNSADTKSSCDVRTIGCVKWFNNKSGYGFISVVGGENDGEDVFVHHSAVHVCTEQYRYLVQGEYVNFTMCKADTSSHEWQAGDVRGLNGGKLMCETRHEVRTRNSTDQVVRPQTTRGRSTDRDEQRTSRQPRYRGQGPREGEVWEVVRKRKT
jgi:cold shock CspA family protein